MSSWTHNICRGCWEFDHPGREPHRVVEGATDPDVCCFCGLSNLDSIFIRHDPKSDTLVCNGVHEEPS